MMAKRYKPRSYVHGEHFMECPICNKVRISNDLVLEVLQTRGGGTTNRYICKDTCYSPPHPQNQRGRIANTEQQPRHRQRYGEAVGSPDAPDTVPPALDISVPQG